MNIIQKIKLNNPEKENLQKTLYEIEFFAGFLFLDYST